MYGATYYLSKIIEKKIKRKTISYSCLPCHNDLRIHYMVSVIIKRKTKGMGRGMGGKIRITTFISERQVIANLLMTD